MNSKYEAPYARPYNSPQARPHKTPQARPCNSPHAAMYGALTYSTPRVFFVLLSLILSSFTPAPCAQEITTFSKEKLTKYVGKEVTLKGKYTEQTKFAPAILSPWSEVVYFTPVSSSSAKSAAPRMPNRQKALFSSLNEGEHITAAGKLYKYTQSKPVRDDVASVSDHFYLDESKVKITRTK